MRAGIRNASPAQEELLRGILAGIGERSIESAAIEKPEADWNLFHEDAVQLTLEGPEESAADFERWLVGGAFIDESHEEGLSPVGVVQINGDGVSTDGPAEHVVEIRSAAPTRELVDRAARVIRSAAAASDAKVQSLRVLQPRGGALAVTLEANDPPQFLARRFERFRKAVVDIWREFPDGHFLRVVDGKRREIYLLYEAARIHASGADVADELEGCTFLPISRPYGWDPPPCPLD